MCACTVCAMMVMAFLNGTSYTDSPGVFDIKQRFVKCVHDFIIIIMAAYANTINFVKQLPALISSTHTHLPHWLMMGRKTDPHDYEWTTHKLGWHKSIFVAFLQMPNTFGWSENDADGFLELCLHNPIHAVIKIQVLKFRPHHKFCMSLWARRLFYYFKKKLIDYVLLCAAMCLCIGYTLHFKYTHTKEQEILSMGLFFFHKKIKRTLRLFDKAI